MVVKKSNDPAPTRDQLEDFARQQGIREAGLRHDLAAAQQANRALAGALISAGKALAAAGRALGGYEEEVPF